jgi:NADH dehydrogenase
VKGRGLLLVTGASGRLGPLVVAALQGDGWRVRALRHTRDMPAADERVGGSLADEPSLVRAVTGVDAIVHLAAVTHARRRASYVRMNVEGTRNLLAAAREPAPALVFVSTRAIDPRGGAYSESKARAEALVAAGPLPFTILRLPEVYGLGGTEGVDSILARARTNRPVPIVGRGDELVCPMHAADAAAAVAGALRRTPAGETYTLGTGCTSVRGFAEQAIELLGSSSRIVSVPAPLVAAAAAASRLLPLPLYPDQPARLRAPKPRPTAAAEAELGFTYRPLESGLLESRP